MPDMRDFQSEFHAELIRPSTVRSPMQVYRNTALLGAIEALRDNFPVTRTIVGDHAFEALAITYARLCPPVSAVLADYGDIFPSWLCGEAIARELTYLVDVADCDRLWVESLHAADALALDPATLAAIDAEDLLELRLDLHPAARFAWHWTPAIDIWRAHENQITSELELEWHPRGALFTRPELTVESFALDAAEYRFLCGIRLGEQLGAAARAAAILYPDADIGACFAGLVQRGAFAALNHERTLQ